MTPTMILFVPVIFAAPFFDLVFVALIPLARPPHRA
jgi:hypothetical protein